jgi:hypothetical protein
MFCATDRMEWRYAWLSNRVPDSLITIRNYLYFFGLVHHLTLPPAWNSGRDGRGDDEASRL